MSQNMNKNNVTVIVEDNLIIVDERAIQFEFTIPTTLPQNLGTLHAIQWHNGKGELEYPNGKEPQNILFETNKYNEYVKPFVDLWEVQREIEDTPPPEPTPEEIKQARILAINQELDEIDRKSIRPERSLRIGRGTDFDTQKLIELEDQADVLRAELQGLSITN